MGLGLSSSEFTSNTNISNTIIGGIAPELTSVVNLVQKQSKNIKGIYDFDIKDVNLQTSLYGRIIPEVFGKMRLSGNIIWSSGIKKNYSKTEIIKDKYGNVSGGESNTSYSVSLAIAICNGVVSEILNIYVDGEIIDIKSIDISIYYGTEIQEPNSIIQAFEGIENTPAYKGICYIVIHNFSLNEYNGRIPNFSFDVVKQERYELDVNHLIKNVCVIPGSGEFVYDTEIQYKFDPIYRLGTIIGYQKGQSINYNNSSGKSDAINSFEQMRKNLPNLEYISLVTSWFGSSLDIENCNIEPKIEYKNIKTTPDEWRVGNFFRENANEVLKDEHGNLRYGGTPSDSSVLKYIDYVKNSKIKVCFYPMLMMDIEDKPWRGNITGNANSVSMFYNKYREFILHYANLLKNKIDVFIIGSEFVGLTKIKDKNNNFPFVDKLCELASEVKDILGGEIKITYAADWSEYHHTDGGWYNLDKLWANSAIDFIGIDAYFPLTESVNSVYDIDEIKKGWEGGECYDFYYNYNKTEKNYFNMNDPWSKRWGIKNIKHFWENEHINPNGNKTQWQSKMKKIWFTEYGFPSVTCTTNQPNVFYSKDSVDSKFPYLSNGEIDFKAQKSAIIATEEFWKDSEFVERKFLWNYDARPYPYFPLLENWSDGSNWQYGHWINGKLFSNNIKKIIEYLCSQVNINPWELIIDDIENYTDGMLINYKTNVVEILKMLADVYDFTAFQFGSQLLFRKISTKNIKQIDISDVIINNQNLINYITIIQNTIALPDKIEMIFVDNQDSRISTVSVQNNNGDKKYSTKIPIAMSVVEAQKLAGKILHNIFLEKDEYQFSLPFSYIDLQIGDIVAINLGNIEYIKIINITLNFEQNCLDFAAVSTNNIVKKDTIALNLQLPKQILEIPGNTNIHLHIIPELLFQTERKNYIKIFCSIDSNLSKWKGCDIYYRVSNEEFAFLKRIENQSITGTVIQNFQFQTTEIMIDNVNKIQVLLNNNAIILTINEDKIGEENLAFIGSEIISFKDINYISDNLIEILYIQRGIYGTYLQNHQNNAIFSMLSSSFELYLPIEILGKNIEFKAVTFKQNISDINSVNTIIDAENAIYSEVKNIDFTKHQNGDLKISWKPQYLTNINFWNGSEPLKYNIYIINNANVIRNYHNYMQINLILTKNEQIELFGNEVTEINVQIFANVL